MTSLVTGATGFIGRRLLSSGDRALVRRPAGFADEVGEICWMRRCSPSMTHRFAAGRQVKTAPLAGHAPSLGRRTDIGRLGFFLAAAGPGVRGEKRKLAATAGLRKTADNPHEDEH